MKKTLLLSCVLLLGFTSMTFASVEGETTADLLHSLAQKVLIKDKSKIESNTKLLISMFTQCSNSHKKPVIKEACGLVLPKLTDNKGTEKEDWQIAQIVWNDRDEHGCIPSAGYSRNETAQECQRPREQAVKTWENTETSKISGESFQAQVFALVNQEREKAGLSALTYDLGLQTVAQYHAKDMADKKFFDHTSLDGKSPRDRCAMFDTTCNGENIAMGQPDPAQVMTSRMNSPWHKANILNVNFKTMGVWYYALDEIVDFVPQKYRVQVFRS